MVPYVRKSFFKHYRDGAIYIAKKDSHWITEHIDVYINDPSCFKQMLSIDAARWKENTDIYQYALAMTEKEVHQAVEGLYHNLNTL